MKYDTASLRLLYLKYLMTAVMVELKTRQKILYCSSRTALGINRSLFVSILTKLVRHVITHNGRIHCLYDVWQFVLVCSK